MNLLREYIRILLLEAAPDLGKKVFAPQAPQGHPHFGAEENTDVENQLFNALKSYLVDNNVTSLIGLQHELEWLIGDPRYSDIFSYDERNVPLYRGQVVSRSVLEKAAGENLQSWIDNPTKPYTASHFYYDPPIFHRRGDMSSWTDNKSKAEHFARGYNRGIHDPVRVVFVANAPANRFLDMRSLYDYAGLDKFSDESESLALEPVELDSIYFVEKNDETSS